MSMNFDKGPYQTIGTGALAELFKQANHIYPVSDKPVRPSLLKRLMRLVKSDISTSKYDNCNEEMNTQTSS